MTAAAPATQPAPQPQRPRSAQLDGLRGLAVISVVWDHIGSEVYSLADYDLSVFLVMSSFLISAQLVRLEPTQATLTAFRNFHIRRILRLWPAYVAALAVFFAFDMDGARETAWWHILFSTNVLFLLVDGYRPWPAAAWWSLGVQEQFYIAISILVFLVPRSRLPLALGLAYLASPIYFILISPFECGGTVVRCDILFPAWISHYAIGALLALAVIGGADRVRRWWIVAPLALGAELLMGSTDLAMALFQPLVAVGIIAAVAAGLPGQAGSLLGSAPLRGLGRISFGIYLYHLPVWWLVAQVLPQWWAYKPGPVVFAICLVATIAVSAASWFAFERRVLDLKRYFPFPPTLRPSAIAGTVDEAPLASAARVD